MRSRSSLLTTEMLDEAPVGRKDLGKSIFSVWDDIFQVSSGKKQRMFLLKGVIDNEHGGLLGELISVYSCIVSNACLSISGYIMLLILIWSYPYQIEKLIEQIYTSLDWHRQSVQMVNSTNWYKVFTNSKVHQVNYDTVIFAQVKVFGDWLNLSTMFRLLWELSEDEVPRYRMWQIGSAGWLAAFLWPNKLSCELITRT